MPPIGFLLFLPRAADVERHNFLNRRLVDTHSVVLCPCERRVSDQNLVAKFIFAVGEDICLVQRCKCFFAAFCNSEAVEDVVL